MKNVIIEISKFIYFVDSRYVSINLNWSKLRSDSGLNFKTQRIDNVVFPVDGNKVQIDSEFFEETEKFRSYLSECFLSGDMEYERNTDSSKDIMLISSRTKNHNSIISKVLTYRLVRPEKGMVSINKCLNDLLGFRIIIPLDYESYDLDELTKELQNYCDEFCRNKCKVRNSSKLTDTGVYRAIHINLASDNYTYPWEIQIWALNDYQSNIALHQDYKQSYVTWERSLNNMTSSNHDIIE